MKKVILIVVGVLVVAGVGAGIYGFASKEKGESITSTLNPLANKEFSPENTLKQPFVASFKISAAGSSQTRDAEIEHNGKGVWRYKAVFGDTTSETIYTDDAYYTKQGGEWYKTTGTGVFKKDDYEITPKELQEFQAAVKNKGKADCPAGTCQLWVAENYQGNDKLSFYVDGNNRISQLKTVTGGNSNTIIYTYKDVAIDVPSDAKQLPSLQQLQQQQ